PRFVTTGDFNRDGNPDLVTANFDANVISILLGNGDGTFQTAVNYPLSKYPVSITVGDFDGDGALDLAVADAGDNIRNGMNVQIMLGHGDGTFAAGATYVFTARPASITSKDFNGD